MPKHNAPQPIQVANSTEKQSPEPSSEVTGELAKALHAIFGSLPSDLVGILGGDRLHNYRARNRERLRKKTEDILRERNADALHSAARLSETLSVIEGAQDEASDELTDLWARLLATTIHTPSVLTARKYFIEVLKQIDPFEARVLLLIFNSHPPKTSWSANDAIVDGDGLKAREAAETLGTTYEDVVAAFIRLEALGCIAITAWEDAGKIALSTFVTDGLRSALFPSEFPLQDMSYRYAR